MATKFNQWIAKKVYGFFAWLGKETSRNYETAPYCGHGYCSVEGKYTTGQYHEGDGEQHTTVMRWLFVAYYHSDDGWEIYNPFLSRTYRKVVYWFMARGVMVDVYKPAQLWLYFNCKAYGSYLVYNAIELALYNPITNKLYTNKWFLLEYVKKRALFTIHFIGIRFRYEGNNWNGTPYIKRRTGNMYRIQQKIEKMSLYSTMEAKHGSEGFTTIKKSIKSVK